MRSEEESIFSTGDDFPTGEEATEGQAVRTFGGGIIACADAEVNKFNQLIFVEQREKRTWVLFENNLAARSIKQIFRYNWERRYEFLSRWGHEEKTNPRSCMSFLARMQMHICQHARQFYTESSDKEHRIRNVVKGMCGSHNIP